MNSKFLQDKVQEIEDEAIEMRLLKRSDKNHECADDKEKVISLAQSTVSLKHYDQLIVDLKCLGCTVNLQAPIYLCMSGHSLCRLCRISVKQCPVCDSAMTNIRSCTLERLSCKFQFPCKNLRNGCYVRLPLELMRWHEEKCVYKKTSCFMGKIWHDCNWRGRENEWLQHCKQKHSLKILQGHESELLWNFETLKHNAGPIVAYYIIENFGETFNLYQIHEAKQSTMTWTIILANYKMNRTDNGDANAVKDLPRFSFEFEFYNKKDPRYLLIQRFPVHYEDSEDVLDDGRCVKVSLNDVQRFLDHEQNLFYRVKIIPEKAKKDRWEELLEKTANQAHHGNFTKDDEFAFFDSAENGNDRVFVNERELVVVSENRQNHDDLLKRIYEKEFTPQRVSQDDSEAAEEVPRGSQFIRPQTNFQHLLLAQLDEIRRLKKCFYA